MVIVLLLGLLFVGCQKEEEKMILSSFLEKMEMLYQYSDKLLEDATTISLEGDGASSEMDSEVSKIMNDIKGYMDEETFQRLISNRMIIESDMVSGKVDKGKIKDLTIKEVSGTDEEKTFQLTYVEDLYSKDQLLETKERSSEFTLKKDDGNQWEIQNIIDNNNNDKK